MEQSQLFRGRDKRKKGWFWMDNEYLNGYAKHFGAVGTAIYVSLCRHADNETQKCFPAMNLIAEELTINRDTVSKYIKLFEKYHLISVQRKRNPKNKKWVNNVYTMLDKEEWISHAELVRMDSHAELTGEPCGTDTKSHAEPFRNKETQNHQDSSKETHIAKEKSFALADEIKKLEDSERRELNIIALYLEHRQPDLISKEQYQVALKRHLRAAKTLVPFSNNQIVDALETAKEQYPAYTLETLIKLLTK